jgi:hypothetical protein
VEGLRAKGLTNLSPPPQTRPRTRGQLAGSQNHKISPGAPARANRQMLTGQGADRQMLTGEGAAPSGPAAPSHKGHARGSGERSRVQEVQEHARAGAGAARLMVNVDGQPGEGGEWEWGEGGESTGLLSSRASLTSGEGLTSEATPREDTTVRRPLSLSPSLPPALSLSLALSLSPSREREAPP